MKKKVVLALLLLFMMSGCQKNYYLTSPRGLKIESVPNLFLCGTDRDILCDETWTYASDSVMVRNVDLSGICKNEVSKRVFSSNDINIIRSYLKNNTFYFEIKQATAVNLGENGIVPDLNKYYKISQGNSPQMFYILIPYKKKKWFHFVHYADVIPVTYLNKGYFIVHTNRDVTVVSYDKIKKILSQNYDSIDVDRWIERCKQGKKKSSYFINEGRIML